MSEKLSFIPLWRRAQRTSVLSELSKNDFMEHTVSFCERKQGVVFVNKEKLKMKATFPSGLCVFFVMYLDIRMIGEHHGRTVHSFHVQKQNKGSGHYVEFRHLINGLRAELAVLDPLARKHYGDIRKIVGKALQETMEKEYKKYLSMYKECNAQK